MSQESLRRRLLAEFLGSAFLLATIVGSGIMAARLAGGNEALALLCNALPTGAMLVVLITVFAPLSGAHFNPVVSLALAMARHFEWRDFPLYVLVQGIGAIVGVWAAHAMFELPLSQIAATVRTGPGQWVAEAVATFGLVLTIFGCAARNPAAIPASVGLYIGAAYWFTASTSFANPAVTLARAFSDSFAGIRPLDVPLFIVAQIVGGIAASAVATTLWPRLSRAVQPGP